MTTADETAALRAATREAHEAIAGLREALRDVRQERRAVRQMLDGIEGRVKRIVAEQIKTEIEEQVRVQVAELGTATERAMDVATAKVAAKFDRLAAIFTGEEDPDREPLETLVRKHVAGRGR